MDAVIGLLAGAVAVALVYKGYQLAKYESVVGLQLPDDASQPEPEPVMPGDNSLPLGLRNNNPLNIKGESYGWIGMVGVDRYGHIIFSQIEYGYRAAARDIRNKWDRWREASIRQLTCTWAEANCERYADFVARRVGVDPNQSFDRATLERVLPRIIEAMAIWENGIAYSNLIHKTEIERGISWA